MVINKKKSSLKHFFTQLSTKKIIFFICFFGFIIFANALFNNFLWDDLGFIINNIDVHSINIAYLFSRNMFNSLGYYRPLSALYFAVLYNIFGSQAFFYHFIQVSLHILNTIILYIALCKIFNRYSTKAILSAKEKDWENLSGSQKIKYLRKHGTPFKETSNSEIKTNVLSFFLALLFLVHPINVESVAYIAASQSELFFLFGILALFTSLKGEITLKHLFLISGLLFLSLLTKETGFLFLLTILFAQFLFYKKRLLKFFLFLLAPLTLYCVIRFPIERIFLSKFITHIPHPITNLSFLERLTNIPAIVFYYITTAFFPLRLVVNQNWVIKNITFQNFYLPLIFDSIFFTMLYLEGVYIYRHNRNYFKIFLFFLFWFICGLLLLVQIFPLDMTVADRWFYFPLAGVLGLLGIGLQTVFSHQNEHASKDYKKVKSITIFIATILIIMLSIRTIIRNSDFHDEMTLFTHDAQIQDNFGLEDSIGVGYFKAGNLKESFIHLQKSIKLYPFSDNLFHLGNWYEDQGDLQKAEKYYTNALVNIENYYSRTHTRNIGENDKAIYIKLTAILLLSEKYQKDEKISKIGVSYYPDSRILWEELAISENKLHNDKQALFAISKAKALAQNDATLNNIPLDEINSNSLSPNSQLDFIYNLIVHKQDIPPFIFPMISKQE